MLCPFNYMATKLKKLFECLTAPRYNEWTEKQAIKIGQISSSWPQRQCIKARDPPAAAAATPKEKSLHAIEGGNLVALGFKR